MLNLFQHPTNGNLPTMPRERNPCVYILASAPRGTTYIGVTSDLAGRLYQHRHGMTGGFVGRHKIYRLVYFEND